MNKLQLLILLTLISFQGCSKSDGTRSEHLSFESEPLKVNSSRLNSSSNEKNVKEVYLKFKQGVLDGNGKIAASCVTASTLSEYESCRKLALDSSNTDFAQLKQFTIIMVFQLRYLLDRSKLQQMSALELFEWGVNEGLVKKETFESIEIHKVQYDGTTAFATLTQFGKASSSDILIFRKESGQWKLDLIESAKSVERQLDKIRKRAGKTKVELAVFLLEKNYGEQISPSILNGPLK